MSGRAQTIARSGQRGFTLAELLVGTFLASIISVAVFTVFVESSDYYGKQLDNTQTQSSLRFAMEYIKADLHDYGRLGIQNTHLWVRDPNYCGVATYAGLEMFDNDRGGEFYQPSPVLTRNNIAPDRIRLYADASDATPLRVNQLTGTTITLTHTLQQPTSEARRFTGIGAEARFAQLFDNSSLTRVTNLNTGRYDVVRTNGAQLVNGIGRVTLAAPTCANLGCASGSCVVNPIHRVEYLIKHHVDEPERTFLARRRLALNDPAPIADSELMIADYVIDFQIWGQYDTRGQLANAIGQQAISLAAQVPEDTNMKDDRGNWAPGVDESERMEFWSHRLRGLNILISARAARVNPELQTTRNLDGLGPQERVTINLQRAPTQGQARVESLIGAVETVNLYRGD